MSEEESSSSYMATIKADIIWLLCCFPCLCSKKEEAQSTKPQFDDKHTIPSFSKSNSSSDISSEEVELETKVKYTSNEVWNQETMDIKLIIARNKDYSDQVRREGYIGAIGIALQLKHTSTEDIRREFMDWIETTNKIYITK